MLIGEREKKKKIREKLLNNRAVDAVAVDIRFETRKRSTILKKINELSERSEIKSILVDRGARAHSIKISLGAVMALRVFGSLVLAIGD